MDRAAEICCVLLCASAVHGFAPRRSLSPRPFVAVKAAEDAASSSPPSLFEAVAAQWEKLVGAGAGGAAWPLAAGRQLPRQQAVIIGAGLSGLACATELARSGYTDFLVLEAADAPGGRVRTDVVDGYLLDRGFQVFIDSYPGTRRVTCASVAARRHTHLSPSPLSALHRVRGVVRLQGAGPAAVRPGGSGALRGGVPRGVRPHPPPPGHSLPLVHRIQAPI